MARILVSEEIADGGLDRLRAAHDGVTEEILKQGPALRGQALLIVGDGWRQRRVIGG